MDTVDSFPLMTTCRYTLPLRLIVSEQWPDHPLSWHCALHQADVICHLPFMPSLGLVTVLPTCIYTLLYLVGRERTKIAPWVDSAEPSHSYPPTYLEPTMRGCSSRQAWSVPLQFMSLSLIFLSPARLIMIAAFDSPMTSLITDHPLPRSRAIMSFVQVTALRPPEQHSNHVIYPDILTPLLPDPLSYHLTMCSLVSPCLTMPRLC
jgi:hypothetical protein